MVQTARSGDRGDVVVQHRVEEVVAQVARLQLGRGHPAPPRGRADRDPGEEFVVREGVPLLLAEQFGSGSCRAQRGRSCE